MLAPPDGTVIVFRNPDGNPIAVPEDVVTAAERAYRCYQERVGGASWEQIAEKELYPSGRAVKADVDRYMQEATAMVTEYSAREMLTLEVARLDAVQNALWLSAMTGHVPSAALVVNVIMNRAKLIGLDPDRMGADANTSRTVVVPHKEDDFLQTLKDAAGEAPPLSTKEKT